VHDFLEGVNLKGMLIRYSPDFLLSGESSFTDKFYTSLYGYISDDGSITFKSNEVKEFENILLHIYDEYCKPKQSFARKDIIRHLFAVFLLKLERKTREIGRQKFATTQNIEKEIYTSFLHLTEQYFPEQQNISYYAKQLGISRRKLSGIVSHFTGKPAKGFIIDKQLVEAKRLLTYSNQNLKDIAYQLSFSSAPYFSRIFKKLTGKTPIEFRTQHKQKK
jgi:AraC-like DNA-binding protein